MSRSTRAAGSAPKSGSKRLAPAPRRKPRGTRGAYAKSADTRERLLAAAGDVAGEFGFHAVSVARIAERAGVAVGNLHYHFGSLDELLHERMQQLADEITATVLRAVADRGDFFEREEAAFRAYLGYLRRHPTSMRLAEEVRVHQPDIHHRVLSQWLGLLRENLREGVACGALRPMEDAEIAALAHTMIGARYFLDQLIGGAHGTPDPGDEAIVASYLRLLRGGLARRPPAPATRERPS